MRKKTVEEYPSGGFYSKRQGKGKTSVNSMTPEVFSSKIKSIS